MHRAKYVGSSFQKPMIGIAVSEKICVSNSLYNILLSGSIVWATRPIFDAPHDIVCNSWSLKNNSALSGLPTFAYLCANQTVSRRAGVASMA